MACCAAHGKEGLALDVINLASHKVDYIGSNKLHLATVPYIYRIADQGVIVFVVSGNKENSERQLGKRVYLETCNC